MKSVSMTMAEKEYPEEDLDSFSKFKSMQLPRLVVVGSKALDQVGETCGKLQLGKRGRIICDKTTKEVAGDRVAEILGDMGYTVSMEIISEASQDVVDDIVDRSKEDVDFFLGVGGGVSIDIAKYSSHLLEIPFVSVPTAASHDGIASGRASINRNGNKISVQAQSPLALVADTGILAESPYRLLASGCADIIANATAVKDWLLAKKLRNEPYSSYAANLS
ncbi:MAG: iron-containing alcohol dehydrogenase, partial [Thermoplasmata archaeon]